MHRNWSTPSLLILPLMSFDFPPSTNYLPASTEGAVAADTFPPRLTLPSTDQTKLLKDTPTIGKKYRSTFPSSRKGRGLHHTLMKAENEIPYGWGTRYGRVVQAPCTAPTPSVLVTGSTVSREDLRTLHPTNCQPAHETQGVGCSQQVPFQTLKLTGSTTRDPCPLS